MFRVLPPWSNMWLIGAIAVSMLLHVLILYVPALSLMFSVCVLQTCSLFCTMFPIEWHLIDCMLWNCFM